MVHTVIGFSVVNEAEVDFFFNSPAFSYDPTDVGNLISGSISVDIRFFWTKILLPNILRVCATYLNFKIKV